MKHLIELVRSKPCLYDTNHPDYSKKTLKDLLWTRIAKEAKYEDDEASYERTDQWKAMWLAKEWSCMQTTRRAPPAVYVTLTLVVLHVAVQIFITKYLSATLLTSSIKMGVILLQPYLIASYNKLVAPWHSYLPKSQGYNWAIAMVAWWTAYCTVILARWVCGKIFGSPTDTLPKICKGVGLSLLVFQEDLYAHYVHGRYDASPHAKSVASPLAMCRVVCAPQLRAVYKKLSTPDYGTLGNTEPNRILLSRFLAAFFERALDGLNWVASERTIWERLVDVELSARDGGVTSALLYDPDNWTPSCFAVTWWGEEWTLATFDAMLFGCILLATDQSLLAALATLVIWQVMKFSRTWLGNRTFREKTEVEI